MQVLDSSLLNRYHRNVSAVSYHKGEFLFHRKAFQNSKSLLSHLTEVLKSLEGRHLFIMGDSLTAHTFNVLRTLLEYIYKNKMHVIGNESVNMTVTGKILTGQKRTDVTFFYTNRMQQNGILIDSLLDSCFSEVQKVGRPNDVFIFNFGISVNMKTLNDTDSNFRILRNISHKFGHAYQTNLQSRNNSAQSIPRYAWREITPQFFNSSNGWYYNMDRGKERKCVLLSDEMRHGNALYVNENITARCKPTCLPADSRVMVSNAIMKEYNISIVPVYEALSNLPIFQTLNNFDCTHFQTSGYFHIVLQILNFVSEQKIL
jgi:hypothetical protein